MPNENMSIKIEQGDFSKENETTTIIVPSLDNSVPNETISIIASNAEAAALGLVSINTYDTSTEEANNALETQEIIVENIDLDALQQHFVITSNSPTQVCKLR